MHKMTSAGPFGTVLLCCGLLLAVAPQVHAQYTSANFSLVPPLITEAAPPNVMLVLSNDHELYKKAYSDFTDIDDDGLVDTGYNDDFSYTGYFDSNFCYDYDSGDSRFEPVTDISATIATDGHRCDSVSGEWSGNFLNWATMTRMDIVRHVLFGGARAVDTATAGATDGVTVLRRVYLPEDTHSFVKVFAGDTERYTPWSESAISLCSTTFGAETNDPLIRVAEGAWPLWASAEVVQCHYRSEAGSDGSVQKPETSDRPGTYEFDVQVQVCAPGIDDGATRCKPYSDSSTHDITYKPIGLLQRYGDNSTINFGLMSGSYVNNISGGVLRKDIVPLTGNSTASLNEIDLNSGRFINQAATDAGIVNTISRFKITSWDYANNRYADCDTYGITKSTLMTSASANRQCRNWGNPLSEIYLEALRYFTGSNLPSGSVGPTTAFNTSDATVLPSLPQLGWTDPLTAASACANCSIIVLSTGLNTFDKDELGSVAHLWNTAGSTRMSSAALNTLLNSLGTLEGITNGSYLIGSNGTTTDDACTAKTVATLATAMGICPEVPSLEGGFDVAALAYHAYTKDLRSDLTGVQSVSTYAVSLAQNLPSYRLNVNGKTVALVPICDAHLTGTTKLDQSGWTNCSFGDARIEQQSATSGSMYVTWEDSLWGSDFDMDAASRIEWCIGTNTASCPGEAPNANYTAGTGQTNFTYAGDFAWKTSGLTADSVQVRVSSPLAAAGNAIRLGVSISGVNNDGVVTIKTNTPTAAMNSGATTVGSGASTKFVARGNKGNGEQYFLLRQGGYNISRLVSNSGNRMIYHEPLVYTASSSVTAGQLLPNPLYLTAKYGSFNDADGDGTPKYNNSASDFREWDVRNVDGEETPDGIPDSYFPITNPDQLANSLGQIFDIISSRISSGTAAAVVANSSTGLGSVYQAYYHPRFTDPNDVTVTWGGVLHAMFIDESGRFREDNGILGKLDDPSIDYVVDIQFDDTASPARTRYQRYTQTGSGPTAVLTPFGGKEDLEDFGSIWNARDVLANISQADLLLQREVQLTDNNYNEDAANKRYIFTWLDSSGSGTPGAVDSTEVVDFIHDNFDSTNGTDNFRYLGLPDPADAANLVKWVRGQDQAGWRSRLADLPGDGVDTNKYWLLGDIVHSSPLVVNPPSERYDFTNGDETYEAFKQKYQRRRQMIYTGGNDGMLHAFNGGVWDAANRQFQAKAYNTVTGLYDVGTAHTLGAEMWAYVPMNLLPHLQWLKELNYPHVYYVDGPPQSYDVNIFTADDTHPGGWGTILVVGMRLGGGDLPVDLDGDAIAETTMSSSFVVLDITDPEQPPTLIAELTAPALGFTTSAPTLVKARVPSIAGSYTSPDTNTWMLVYGSGPDTMATAVSNAQDATLHAYDLVNRVAVTVHADAQTPAADPSGYFGDLQAVDWENDFVDDVIYVGTVEGTESAPTGRLKRIRLDYTAADMGLSTGTADMSLVYNMAQPLSAAPAVQVSVAKSERWVLFGTGRLFTSIDNRSTTQQSFYGIKEPVSYDTSAVTAATLVDTTNILVKKTDGTIHEAALGVPVTRFSTNLANFTALYNFMDNRPGWVHKFSYSSGTNPSERVFNTSLLLGSTLVFTSYQPSVDQCVVEGTGYLYALNYRTGTAEAFGTFGENPLFSGVAAERVTLGQGAPSAPAVITSTGDDIGVGGETAADVSIISGLTTGETTNQGGTLAPVQRGRLSWEMLELPF